MMTTDTTTGRVIRQASFGDLNEVAATVAAGFFDDPVTRWLLPDVDRRRRLIAPLFRLYVEPYLAHGETYLTADGAGAGVWLPPDTQLLPAEDEERLGQALAELTGPDVMRFAQLAETVAQCHPDEPLYYCQFLATVPAYQGQGIGSSLLRGVLSRADREHMPTYLEATSPRNKALYERHGYVNRGAFTLPDGGPPLWRMWRDPR